MKRLALQLPSPAESLAADEALLEQCEARDGDETLVFWEPQTTFVVVGYANKVATEVNLDACQKRGVPVFRRCSGGGTVVQLPGGLNYSLLLRISETGPTRSISAANQFIMEKNSRAIAELLPASGISVRGHTDLCVGSLKFAGNAQRRRKHFLLFHGTLLLNCDVKSISELLPMPSLQPEYRSARPHADFVTNLGLPAGLVQAAFSKEWKAEEELQDPPWDQIQKMAREKYSTREWNYKF